jgi:hypothetical protein
MVLERRPEDFKLTLTPRSGECIHFLPAQGKSYNIDGWMPTHYQVLVDSYCIFGTCPFDRGQTEKSCQPLHET